jgi:ribosomal protein S18 acetylase RimI-like enzyme
VRQLTVNVPTVARPRLAGAGVEQYGSEPVAHKGLLKGLRRIGGVVLLRLQSRNLYRRLGRRAALHVTLREASDADYLAVQRWLNPNGSSSHGVEHDPDVTNWVAVYRGHLVGFVQLVRHPQEQVSFVGHWLFSLTIKPLCRGLGIGEALTQVVVERARAEGAPALNLLVFEDNVPAIRLYEKLGFEMHTIPGLEPQLESERVATGRRRVVMRKHLAERGPNPA